MNKNKVSIKYVKAASSWCRTTFNEKGKQVQEWSKDKPEE